MKRRNFTQSVMAGVGLSSLPLGVTLATQSSKHALQEQKEITSKDGLKLKLNQRVHPTNNKDRKQFILTYDVQNSVVPLLEKTYELKMANGDVHQVYMTPVNSNQLQAVFNTRLNA